VETQLTLLGTLENGLFALGQVLRLPVMVLLWVCVFAALFLSGRCLVEFVIRRRERSGFDLRRWLNAGPVIAISHERQRQLPTELRSMLEEIEQVRTIRGFAAGELEHVVLSHEARVRRRLSAPRVLVKVGPSLGLLGTLIPMGSSLAALASGNLEAMAGQMVVAFTTTIIGLATGTLAYMIAAIEQSWVSETVHEQRYLAERIAAETAAEI
jgi:biopolymer transport protein ExbB/TolQ